MASLGCLAWIGAAEHGPEQSPPPGLHVTSLVYPFGRDCGPASPLGAGEPRGHRAAPPGIRFSSGSKTFLRHMVPWPPSPGTENTVLGSRLGLTLSVWGEALEGDVENPAAPVVSDCLLRSQAAGGVCPVGGAPSSFFAVFCFSGTAPSEMQLALPLKARAQSQWWSPVHRPPPHLLQGLGYRPPEQRLPHLAGSRGLSPLGLLPCPLPAVSHFLHWPL